MDQAGETMAEVVSSIKRVTDLIGEISAASNEQAAGVAQVGEAVTQMDQATQQNAALVEQMAAAASSLKSQAGELVQTVAVFKLETSHHALSAPVAPPSRPRPAALASNKRLTVQATAPKPKPAQARLPQATTTPRSKSVLAAKNTTAGSDDGWETF